MTNDILHRQERLPLRIRSPKILPAACLRLACGTSFFVTNTTKLSNVCIKIQKILLATHFIYMSETMRLKEGCILSSISCQLFALKSRIFIANWYWVSVFLCDLQDYTTTYRATGDAYLKTVELELHSAARDACVAATAIYTKSLHDKIFCPKNLLVACGSRQNTRIQPKIE